jgi:hypothetical protein
VFPVEHRFATITDGFQLLDWEQRPTRVIEKVSLLLAFEEEGCPGYVEGVYDVFG